MAPPYTEAYFDIVFGEGINHVMDVFEAAERLGVIETAGSWSSFRGERLGHGREQVEQKLKEEPDLLAILRTEVLDRFHAVPDAGPEMETTQSEAA